MFLRLGLGLGFGSRVILSHQRKIEKKCDPFKSLNYIIKTSVVFRFATTQTDTFSLTVRKTRMEYIAIFNASKLSRLYFIMSVHMWKFKSGRAFLNL